MYHKYRQCLSIEVAVEVLKYPAIWPGIQRDTFENLSAKYYRYHNYTVLDFVLIA